MTTKTTPSTTKIAFDQVCECGTYVCNWNGHLFQVPDNCFKNGSPSWNYVATEKLFVTKISDNWQIPVEEARNLANECNVTCNF